MTEYTAIVEAGEALVRLLQKNMTPQPISGGEQIVLASPHDTEETYQLSVFLFHLEQDANNTQAGYYQASANVQRMNPTYYTLYFLLTPHSKAPLRLRESDQYRIIGAAAQTIAENPVIPRDCLAGSLADDQTRLHLSVQRSTLDEMVKIWNNNANRFKLSLVCKLESVPISPRRERRVARVGDVTIETVQKPQAVNGDD